jgi:hypothetical protein
VPQAETINYQTSALETDSVSMSDSHIEPTGDTFISELEGFSKEYIQAAAEELGSALDPILAVHADTIVICERLGGVEMTLSQAVNTIWSPSDKGAMVKEGLPGVLAEIQRMLNNRKEKSEEKEEKLEEEPAKKEDADQKEQADKSVADTDRQSEKAIHVTKQPEPSKSLQENSQASGRSTTPTTAGVAASHVQNESKQTNQNIAKAETPDNSSDGSVNVNSADTLGTAETPAHKGGKAISSGGGTSIDKARTSPDRPQVVDRATVSPDLPKETIAVSAESEQTELSDSPSQLTDEEIEVIEDASIYTAIEYEENADLTDFIEGEELLIDYLDDTAPEDIENVLNPEEALVYRFSDESDLPDQIENTSPEQSHQISLSAEEIEVSLIQLAEVIEVSEPEITEKVNEILDKIIEMPVKLEAQTSENITEVNVQEELEELFIELFDILSIEYTPELIQSLAYLTLRLHLVDEIEKLKEGEEMNETPQSSGTHEIIKKLLTGISNLKKAIANSYAIGKSALRLYSFNFASALNT